MPDDTSARGGQARTDEQLMADFANAPDKNEDAFNELVKRHYNVLLNFASKFLNNQADGQDAVQETCRAIFRSAKTFNPASKFSAWVYTICKNECLKIIRNKPDVKELPKDAEGNDIEIEDEKVKQDNKCKELREEYLNSNVLDGKERKIIELHLLDGKTYLEIQTTNPSELRDEKESPLSINAMEKNYNRALKKLQQYHRKKIEGI
ncbi:MAG: sigma-70 family RNA polymerase sigma factor [Planctomycetota bacterium]